ncbi:MAG: hypothetical protein ACI9IP_002932 [Arcticibacterium sp.]|jgi:hypothetical protein
MFKRSVLLIISALASFLCGAQELYIPRDIEEAYKNKTRDISGNPGEAYWQNKGVYKIKLKINPPSKTIEGSEDIVYTNNSKETLNSLNFKLYLNNHKPGATRERKVGNDLMTSGVHIDNYLENGLSKTWDSDGDGVNKTIRLSNALAPNESVSLHLDWHYDLTDRSGREGTIDSTTFFLAYFYPRIAVYDDYSGWDKMDYAGFRNYYHDFNDYSLEVTVPKNYIVWATGDLIDPEEVLQPKYANRFKESMLSDSIIKIATANDLIQAQITKQNETNTFKFQANNITDVALALSNHYNWDASSVLVDSMAMRRVSVQSAYDDVSIDFHKMVEFGRHGINWFSNNYPGIPYPFSKITIVRGFGDMEYPMMVNDNSRSDIDFSRFVAEHEIAHSYFPFYMGINETRFAFMDEGWATALEYLIGISDLGKETATENFKKFRVNRWINSKSMEQDIPIITPSNIVKGAAYGINAYGKPALGYLALKDLLGDLVFKTTLKSYMETWNSKHPIPWDFFYCFNNFSGQNLNWFWNRWFFSNHYIDLRIDDVKNERGQTIITVKNIGGMPVPFDVILTSKSGLKETIHQTPAVWEKHKESTEIIIDNFKDLTSIRIEGGIFMDADLSDNAWDTN